MKSIIVTIPTAINNNDLPILNRMEFAILKKGDGSGIVIIQIHTISSDVKVSVKGVNAKFYTTLQGDTVLGSGVNLNLGSNTMYLKASNNDVLFIDNAQNIDGFGNMPTDWSGALDFFGYQYTINSPILQINYDTFKYLQNLKCLSIGVYRPLFIGDYTNLYYQAHLATIRGLKMTNYNDLLKSMVPFTSSLSMIHISLRDVSNNMPIVDINNIVPSSFGLMVYISDSILTYSGSQTKEWGKIKFFQIIDTNSTTIQSQIDNLLISLAATASLATCGGTKRIIVSAARTSASDAAVSTLQAKGFTVTVNDPS